MICDPIGDYKAGVIVSTIRFAKLLQERGHTVIFIGANSGGEKGEGTFKGMRTYRYPGIPLPKSGGWHLAFPKVSELKRVFIKEEIDIVHIVLPMSGAISAIKAAKTLGIKIVAHSHSQPENLFMDMPKFLQPILGGLWNRYLAWVYSKAGSIIYPSEMAHELLSNLTRQGQFSAVVSNGIDTEEFRPLDIGDFNSRFAIPPGRSKLLFVGRLFPEKSIDTLIKALPAMKKQFGDAYVMIAGAGREREKLERLSKELGVADSVNFLGLISEEDKIRAYNACDIFVLSSLAELEGMVVLEAMACGKPILVSNAKMSASRFFVRENGFLFESRNPADLASQAAKLLSNPHLRKEMGHQSILRSKEYDIRKSVDKLEEIYHSALKDHAGVLS